MDSSRNIHEIKRKPTKSNYVLLEIKNIKQPLVKLSKKECVSLFEEENLTYNPVDVKGIIKCNGEIMLIEKIIII